MSESEVSATSGYRSMDVQIHEHVATVTLRGTGAGNALGRAVWEELPRIFRRLDGNAAVRAIILRGAGDCFSVGLDLRWYVPHLRHAMRLGSGLAAARAVLLREAQCMQEAVSSIADCRHPVIAAVHGSCIGGGLDLVTACDFRLAAAGAVFSVAEVRIGVVADLGVLQRLPRIIGNGHARELALTGSEFDTSHALRIGLVNHSYDDPRQLFAAAHAMADCVAGNSPTVVEGIKQVLSHDLDLPIRASLRYAALWNAAFMPSHDQREAIDAMLQDRSPRFSRE